MNLFIAVRRWWRAALFALCAVAAPSVSAIELSPVLSGLSNPVLATHAGDGSRRLFVVEQVGRIRVLQPGATTSTTFLDISTRLAAGGERGLLGLAFHPQYAANGRFFVFYTRSGDGALTIAEYRVSADPNVAGTVSAVLLTIPHPGQSNHNGGMLAFGPDGYLYIGMGDGGSADDPQRRALDVGELLGKILRIDPLPADGAAYTVPSDNPFVGVSGARPEIWSVGVRNPWRFNFDSASGDLWIGDVGQGQWEEIDLARAVDGGGRGINFGWSAWEGTHRFNDDQPDAGATMPIFEYEHGEAGCSVSGGDVYRGTALPSLVGWYLFSDYCSGIITALQATDGELTGHLELGTLAAVSAINAGPDGELYVLSLGDGVVYRVAPAG